jgi:hypothetical protein
MSDTVSYDYSIGDTTGVAGFYGKPISRLTRVVSVPAILAADAGTSLASASKITADESISVFTLPVGFLVLGAVCYVETAGTGTIDVGVPAYETNFLSASSLTVAGAWTYTDTETYSMAASSGWLITSTTSDADNVIVQFNSDETVAEFVISIFGIDFSDMADMA